MSARPHKQSPNNPIPTESIDDYFNHGRLKTINSLTVIYCPLTVVIRCMVSAIAIIADQVSHPMIRLFALFLITLSLLSVVIAQSFKIPSNWRKPTSTLSRLDRLTLVDGLLNTVSQTLNSLTNTQTANMLCALAIGDHINNSTTSQDVVLNSLNTRFKLVPHIIDSEVPKVNSDPAIWGLAAIYAYTAYRDQASLQYAQSIWTQLTKDLVTATVSSPRPSGTLNISTTCNNASTAGGVFFIQDDPNNMGVNGETTAAFMALSAHLYEQTLIPQYLSAATLSADFVINHLYDGKIILDAIDIGSCSLFSAPVTYNSGFTIDGLSVLASASSNSSYSSFLSNLISTAVVYPHWTNTVNGVIIEGPGNEEAAAKNDFGVALKAILIRGLYQTYMRNPNNTDQAAFIRGFITVQLNALLDLASVTGSNQYSPRWEGPPPEALLPWGQLAAADVLVAAVGLTDTQNPSSPPSPQPTSPSIATYSTDPELPTSRPSSSPFASSDSSRSISAGAIGGIAAGIISLLLIILAATIVLLRRKRRRHIHEVVSESTTRLAIPMNGETRVEMRDNHAQDNLGALPLGVIPPSKLRDRRASTRRGVVPNYYPTPPAPNIPSHSVANASSRSDSSPRPERDARDATSSRIREKRPLVGDLASFPGLVGRPNRVMMNETRSEHVGSEGESEALPRYEE
ncbi:hypothetical protein BDY19DRAFT_998713 [Irpex rosettiformis]|uniref:Uncharacterized protein n=1 Tax=Irpex rosettiformis TaxID=378272 RepID=A0ACB8TML6_9APHY|nr:hypothetical protein BDY19DRAFT_998713 [Irpex rosettiformis]